MASVSLLGVQKDISVAQGSTIDISFALSNSSGSPLDMSASGWALNLQVRQTAGSSATIISASLGNGIEWIDAAQGTWHLFLEPSATSSISSAVWAVAQGNILYCVYDMEVVSPTDSPGTQKPWYGNFLIQREVTR
jgi:hypothetical protein